MVLDAADQDAPRMQRLAAWPNLPETVSFLPPEAGADYRIRIFTQGRTAIRRPPQRRRRLGGGRDVANQGRELGRDSRVELLVDGEDVWSGGLVQAVIAGKIAW
ncbi:PhzF family phenazine biosynthesis protein [Xanthomonas sacchari]|uniref:PhzF family phenazine biosynthesis protein n=1 Tax=Xanthomonas sacchari TaxID=56458 RepID=UPI003D188CEB